MEQKNEKSGVSRNKVLQVIASILVAVAIWVYVDVEKAPERTKTSSVVPLRTMSSSRICRSNTMSTPVLLWDISLQAITVWSMAFSTSDCCCAGVNALSSRMFLLPSFSKI